VGVYRTAKGSAALVKVGGDADFMGFVRNPFDKKVYWGSGHNPMAGLNNWGFVESLDEGKTWQVKGLKGQIDFHQMDASTSTKDLVGGTWGGKLWVSTDAGKSWKSHAWAKAATGVLLESPTSALLASKAGGVERVTVPAMTAKTLKNVQASALCRHGKGVMIGTYDTKLHVCDGDAGSCQTIAGPGGQRVLQCLVDPANVERMYVLLAGSAIHHSDDGGKTWALIVAGK